VDHGVGQLRPLHPSGQTPDRSIPRKPPHLPVELVRNPKKKTFFGSETIRKAEAMLGLQVASWVPDDPGGERRAIDLELPTTAVRSKGRKTYRSLAKRLSATAISSSYDFV
jgi:pilus assembly protein CpaE